MIYFDHSATTPVDKRVLDEMLPYFNEKFGNPSSVHGLGKEAMSGVDKARYRIADFLNCDVDEIIFTGGSTESNNLVLRGVINALKKENTKKVGGGNCLDISSEDVIEDKGNWRDIFKFKKSKNIHIITTQIEHKAVLNPSADLEREGIEVSYLPVDSRGIIDLDDLRNAVKENTVLISIMYVNSEVGSAQPIREIGKIIKKINEKRYKEWQKIGARKKKAKPQSIYFHTDATQALNFFDCNVKKLHVDFMSISAHKIYGPKGVGALFMSNNANIKAIQTGGDQEKGIRSGTLNVAGIVGLGKAVELLNNEREKNNLYIANLRKKLVDGILNNIKDVVLNTDLDNSTPSHAHFTFSGVSGESILMSLDKEGIAVSVGSACSARNEQSSHVLTAMGISRSDANSAVRFTLGKNNTEEDIDKLISVLCPMVERMRKLDYK